MFYTKYRPQKFSELFGLESVAKALTSQLAKNQVGHAFLFFGPRGTGKTTTARILAREVSCRGLDLIEIDAASNRGIDDIRSLREKINLAPTESAYKVYVIDEVHMLTKEAFNALLKTLEEPPKHAILILCTTEPHKVPETIRSRCQKFEFKRARTADIVKKLKFIVEKEKAEVADKDLELIAKNAAGGFRDAETMLEQMVVGGLPAAEVVGLAVGESVGEFVELLLNQEVGEAIKFVNRMYEEHSDLLGFNQTVLEYFRSLLLIQAQVGEELLEAPEENYKQLSEQSSRLSGQILDYMIKEFTQVGLELQDSPIPQLPLELSIARIVEKLKVQNSKFKIGNGEVGESPHKANSEDEIGTIGTKPTSDIVGKWDSVLKSVKSYNHSLEALLKSCRPLKIEDGSLILEVFYKFHKERLEEPRNRNILENVASKVLGIPTKVRCVLGKKVDSPKVQDDVFDELEKSAVEVFNGEL